MPTQQPFEILSQPITPQHNPTDSLFLEVNKYFKERLAYQAYIICRCNTCGDEFHLKVLREELPKNSQQLHYCPEHYTILFGNHNKQ